MVTQESPMPARPAPLGMKSGREGEWRRPLAVGEVEVVYRLVLIARSGV